MKRILTLATALVALMAAMACGGGSDPTATSPAATPTPEPQVINWKMSSVNPESHYMIQNVLWWTEQVRQQTNGQLNIEVFAGGALPYAQAEHLDAVSRGLVEVAGVWGGSNSGVEQALEVLEIPGLVPPDVDVRFELANTLFQPYQALLSEKYDVELYWILQLDPRNLYMKDAVSSLDEFQGLKIRAMSPLEVAFTGNMGAAATPISAQEVYTALQQGLVDGVWIVDSGTYVLKWYEVAKYIVDIKTGGAANFLSINKTAYDALPADIRQVLVDLRPQLMTRVWDSLKADMITSRQRLLDEGMEVIQWPDSDLATISGAAQQVLGSWYEDASPDAKQIFDRARAIISEAGN